MHHKSTRLPIVLCHMDVCRIVTSNYFIRVISHVQMILTFFDGINRLRSCHKNQDAYVSSN